jgi:nitroreductase/NAD-dependent dihydropyrimidine dehydrogenase PreA subunit
MLHIDRTRCQRDGLCAAVCPMDLIITDDAGFPVLCKGGAELCIACGHCAAICPQSALVNEKLPGGAAPAIDPNLSVAPAALAQLLRSRRSIREFRSEPVPREAIEQALDAARWAPSAVNRQPVHWLVVQTPAEVRRLAGLVAEFLRQGARVGTRYAAILEQWDQGNDLILRGAPQLVVAHAPQDWAWSAVDCTIALTQIELALVNSGIGTCWAGFLSWAARDYAPLKQALGLPAGREVYGALMLGLPRYTYPHSPPRQPAQVEWR